MTLLAADSGSDTARLDWILDHATITGGGRGFELRVWIPHDLEDVRTAIDAELPKTGESATSRAVTS